MNIGIIMEFFIRINLIPASFCKESCEKLEDDVVLVLVLLKGKVVKDGDHGVIHEGGGIPNHGSCKGTNDVVNDPRGSLMLNEMQTFNKVIYNFQKQLPSTFDEETPEYSLYVHSSPDLHRGVTLPERTLRCSCSRPLRRGTSLLALAGG